MYTCTKERNPQTSFDFFIDARHKQLYKYDNAVDPHAWVDIKSKFLMSIKMSKIILLLDLSRNIDPPHNHNKYNLNLCWTSCSVELSLLTSKPSIYSINLYVNNLLTPEKTTSIG